MVPDAVLEGVGTVRRIFDVDTSILRRISRGIEWACFRSSCPSRFEVVVASKRIYVGGLE